MIRMETERNETGGVSVSLAMKGTTDALIEELAAGAAHAVVMMADDLPAQDELHESLARELAGAVLRFVGAELAQRDRDYVDGIGDA